MIDLIDETGREADLVTIAGVTVGCGCHELTLWQLTLHGLLYRYGRIAGTGDTHRLINIASAGQRITDRATDTGGRTTERLDLGRVVMGLVLKEQEPVLILAIDIDLDLYGAGIDLLRLIELLELSFLLQHLRSEGTDIHEVDRLRAVQLLAGCDVTIPCLLELRISEIDMIDCGQEGGMTAVIGPVGIDHADLCDARITMLGLEVITAELEIVEVHREALLLTEGIELLVRCIDEAREGLDLGRDVVLHIQGRIGVEGSLSRLYRVDDILLDFCDLIRAELSVEEVHLRGTYLRALTLGEDLDALCGRVCALVELTRQELDGEYIRTVLLRKLSRYIIELRLAEDELYSLIKGLLVQSLDVVTVQKPYVREVLDQKDVTDIMAESLCLVAETLLLLNINSIYHGS